MVVLEPWAELGSAMHGTEALVGAVKELWQVEGTGKLPRAATQEGQGAEMVWVEGRLEQKARAGGGGRIGVCSGQGRKVTRHAWRAGPQGGAGVAEDSTRAVTRVFLPLSSSLCLRLPIIGTLVLLVVCPLPKTYHTNTCAHT